MTAKLNRFRVEAFVDDLLMMEGSCSMTSAKACVTRVVDLAPVQKVTLMVRW